MWPVPNRSGSIVTRLGTWRGRLMLGLATAAIALGAAPAGARALQLGFQDNGFFTPTLAPLASQTMAQVDGSWLRLLVRWSLVAPPGPTMPSGFDPTNPADPLYKWSYVDAFVRNAAAQHLNLIINLLNAPQWAEGPNNPGDIVVGPGAWDPNPTAFGDFARAAATRYNGNFPDPLNPGQSLPHVKYWEIWNEENVPENLSSANPIATYRSLLNAADASIKGVDSSNVVSVGGLAPVGYPPPRAIPPLKFAVQLMCLRRIRTTFRARKSCPSQAQFDVMAFHPYSLAATPTTHADVYDDLLIADTGKLAAAVKAADRLHTVSPREKHPLWVTEWSWFTNPPNNLVGDAGRTAARYVDYSMWLLWRYGVKLVIWFTIEDPVGTPQTLASFITGGGLYTSTGRQKMMFRAFQFPVYASISRAGRGYVWGRAPISHRATVVIERSAPGHLWIRAGTARTHSDGTFVAHLRHARHAVYRARVRSGVVSLGYRPIPIAPGRTHPGFPT
jgi:hypothetical protein